VIQCTKKALFTSTLPTLTGINILVTSVLSNFISDGCMNEDDFTSAANREITAHVETLHQYSLSCPETRIAIAPPLSRTSPEWFPAYLPGFCSFLYHEVTRMSNPNLRFMAPFPSPPSYFESDGIHLDQDAGNSFIYYLVTGCDQLFPPEMDTDSQILFKLVVLIFEWYHHRSPLCPNRWSSFGPMWTVGGYRTTSSSPGFSECSEILEISEIFRTSEIRKYSFRLENRPESSAKSSECRALIKN